MFGYGGVGELIGAIVITLIGVPVALPTAGVGSVSPEAAAPPAVVAVLPPAAVVAAPAAVVAAPAAVVGAAVDDVLFLSDPQATSTRPATASTPSIVRPRTRRERASVSCVERIERPPLVTS